METSSSHNVNRAASLKNTHDKKFTSYAQISQTYRQPSVLEEFGSGNGIQPNFDLESEETIHKEIGLHYSSGNRRHFANGSLFQDSTTDKIVFVQATQNTSKATNISSTETTGAEVTYQYKHHNLSLLAAGTWLDAQIKSTENESNKIPRIPGAIRSWC